MSNEFNYIEAFEAYYNHELSANAKIDFEERLDSDADFKHEYNLYLQLQKALEDIGDEQLKTKLNVYHHHHVNATNGANLQLIIYFSGFMLLLIVVGLLNLRFTRETAHKRIEARTAHIEVNPNIEPLVLKNKEQIKTEDTIASINTQTTEIINNTKPTQQTVIKFPIKKYIIPFNPLYELNDSTLHLYGFDLKNGEYILSEQNNLYLVTPSNSYLLEINNKKNKLQKVRKRLYESVINTKNQSKRITKLHQVVFEESVDSITISFDKKLPKSVYSFEEKTITISDSVNQQIQFINFENTTYLLNSDNLFRLNKGTNQQLKIATQAEKNGLKSTTTTLPILTETVEKGVEWQNSN